MHIEELGFADWERTLPKDGYDVFHSAGALRVVDDHSTADLRLFAAFKGEQPVGLIPLFIRRNKIGQIVTSPPPGFGIERLGPLVLPTSPKRRKRETLNKKFAQEIIDQTGADTTSSIFRMTCDPQYGDPRPYQWAGFNIVPSFTYRINLESTNSDQLLKSFSRDRRKEIQNRDEAPVTIRMGGKEEAKQTYESIQARYREQDLKVPYGWEFVRDLVDALDDRVRIYTAESDTGEFVSGIIVLYSNETAYNWKGGTKITDRSYSISPNTLLHWKIIEDILEDPALDAIERYDMYTANNERLSEYKSSFGGHLTQYYTVESSSISLRAAKGIYRITALRKDPFGEESIKSMALGR